MVKMLKDNNGKWSLKRVLAFIGSICLFVKLFTHESGAIVDACLMIILIGIGGSVAEKFKKD
jgi:hypothetical protein